MSSSPRMPAGFVAHGAPLLALETGKAADLKRWADAMPRPRAIVVVSAHWEATPPTLGTRDHTHLMYDFYGFPPELYALTYPTPGVDEQMFERVNGLLGGPEQVRQAPDRHMDHGAWVPLRCMYPEADIPTLQVSLPSHWEPERLFEMGRALGTLRKEGVLILGSGSLVHNLSRVVFNGPADPPEWAVEFDAWCRDVTSAWRIGELFDYRTTAPSLAIAQPTVEHFLPMIVAAGAGAEEEGRAPKVSFPVEGFEFGTISRRCVQFG